MVQRSKYNSQLALESMKWTDLSEYQMEADAKKLFKLGSRWENRKGAFVVTHVDPKGKGIKIKYDSINMDYVDHTVGASKKKKEWHADGFVTLKRIHDNIQIEKAIAKENKE